MDRHCDNAEKVVEFLASHAAVSEVIYPGLESHPGHAVAAKQMKRFGGMVSFRVTGGVEQALRVCESRRRSSPSGSRSAASSRSSSTPAG